jgi:hypothetical protein
MDGLMLLRQASKAGLAVQADGDRLVIRGPRRAEAVARLLIEYKPEVIAALAPAIGPSGTVNLGDGSDPAWWRRRFTIRAIHWGLSGRWTKAEADRIAYGELLDEWRNSHGQRWPVSQCAGCDEPLGGLSALSLADENRVHFDEQLECLIRFGRRWRSEAVAGLRALGLDPPPGFELL